MSLSSAEYVVNEGAGFVVVVIEKSGITPNNEQTEVLLTLMDGTAQGVCCPPNTIVTVTLFLSLHIPVVVTL